MPQAAGKAERLTVAANPSQPSSMRIATLNKRLITLLLASLLPGALWAPSVGYAQTIVVIVNDEPITSFDVDQRMRWAAITHNFNDRMMAILKNPATDQKFRQMVMATQPHSQQEFQQAQERVKKQIVEDAKRRVLAEGGGTSRKAVIDTLIEDKLKVQAAKKLDVKVTDREVEESVEQRAASDGVDKKAKVEAFYQQFEAAGISRRTVQEVFRAQLSWRNVIGRVYGPRIQSAIAAIAEVTPEPAQGEIQFDVRVLKLAVKDVSDQKAIGERMLEAENLKEKFHSCTDLPKEAKLVADATVKAMDKVKLASFPTDVQPLIDKVGEGQMTPPVLIGNAVESYAVCHKGVPVKQQQAKTEQKPDPRMAEYERYSRIYLQVLKQKASIDDRGS